MQCNRIIAAGIALVATVTAGSCLAQSATDQPAPSTATSMQSDTPAPLTREQVMREQADFQNSAQAAEMREIYRGGS
ncbi:MULTISPECIES: hypothetical protein [unclassified Caballeronia]|uniref:hypothetical protein n=1 Tax=unclassified Caballeronia TaxID=2646786 RepID=UPI00285677A1|nr:MULTISPECIES: hypothetical protein [unclassified Caballeronia]MDR5816311.1 hypothetical protein [Caballeronia sp. LZ033]MDR5822978.1 hypothetical protein [Caballeronia sp. LZ043]MDR5881037.1 hypothetical protein [Caballeronia sp. LZ032]